jgi:hypothetical protein
MSLPVYPLEGACISIHKNPDYSSTSPSALDNKAPRVIKNPLGSKTHLAERRQAMLRNPKASKEEGL